MPADTLISAYIFCSGIEHGSTGVRISILFSFESSSTSGHRPTQPWHAGAALDAGVGPEFGSYPQARAEFFPDEVSELVGNEVSQDPSFMEACMHPRLEKCKPKPSVIWPSPFRSSASKSLAAKIPTWRSSR